MTNATMLPDGEIIEATERAFAVPPIEIPLAMSPTIAKLATALAKAQATLKAALKDATNPHFNSRYADLQAIWSVCQDVLPANEIAVMQFPSAIGNLVTITTMLAHSSGEFIMASLTMSAQRADPQGVGSAITYGRRYGLAAAVGVVSDEDDDGNAASRPARKNAITDEQIAAVNQAARAKGMDADSASNEAFGLPLDELTGAQGQKLLGSIKAAKPAPKPAANPEAITDEQFGVLSTMFADLKDREATAKLFGKKFGAKSLRELPAKYMIQAVEWLDSILATEAEATARDGEIKAGEIPF